MTASLPAFSAPTRARPAATRGVGWAAIGICWSRTATSGSSSQRAPLPARLVAYARLDRASSAAELDALGAVADALGARSLTSALLSPRSTEPLNEACALGALLVVAGVVAFLWWTAPPDNTLPDVYEVM